VLVLVLVSKVKVECVGVGGEGELGGGEYLYLGGRDATADCLCSLTRPPTVHMCQSLRYRL
jgi:hypothetical protein